MLRPVLHLVSTLFNQTLPPVSKQQHSALAFFIDMYQSHLLNEPICYRLDILLFDVSNVAKTCEHCGVI